MVDNVIDYINPSMYDYDADKQKCCDIYVICAIASSLISNQSRLTFPKIQILFFFFFWIHSLQIQVHRLCINY